MGVLRANIGGQWVDIGTDSGTVDEVAVGPNDPGPGYDLWFDTDAVAPFQAGAPMFAAYMAANLTIGADATWYVIPYDVIQLDIGSRWNPTNKSWVAPRAGWIEVTQRTVLVFSGAVASANAIASIMHNSAERRVGQSHADQATFGCSGVLTVQVAAGDVINGGAYMTASGIGKAVYGSPAYSSFVIRYIS